MAIDEFGREIPGYSNRHYRSRSNSSERSHRRYRQDVNVRERNRMKFGWNGYSERVRTNNWNINTNRNDRNRTEGFCPDKCEKWENNKHRDDRTRDASSSPTREICRDTFNRDNRDNFVYANPSYSSIRDNQLSRDNNSDIHPYPTPIRREKRERNDRYNHHRGRRQRNYPVERYMERVLMCEYLWKKEVGIEVTNNNSNNISDFQKNDNHYKRVEESKSPVDTKNTLVSHTNKKNTKEDSNTNTNTDVDTQSSNQSYVNYVQLYCLTYIRTFFNEHLDDPWFRSCYSPLEYKRKQLQHQSQKIKEAEKFYNEAQESLIIWNKTNKQKETIFPKKNVPCFIKHARLGGGIKQNGDDTLNNTVPKTHLLSFVASNSILKVMDVPSHVTDTQLAYAVSQHCDIELPGGAITNVWSESVLPSGEYGIEYLVRDSHTTINPRGLNKPLPNEELLRSAWVLFETESGKEKMLRNLTKTKRNKYLQPKSIKPNESHPQRKVLELTVECTDPYDRLETDADGCGSAPSSSPIHRDTNRNNTHDDRKNSENGSKVSIKRVTVFVSTISVCSNQSVSVLSAAVSSSKRIHHDYQSAAKLAKGLDEKYGIKPEYHCESILSLLFENHKGLNNKKCNTLDIPQDLQKVEDRLDITIAYLRRVHLLSFYNGCTSASCVSTILSGGTNTGSYLSFISPHPASVIHLRLKDADKKMLKAVKESFPNITPLQKKDPSSEEDPVGRNDARRCMEDNFVKPAEEAVESMDPVKLQVTITNSTQSISSTNIPSSESRDMLVMRFDESISQALRRLSPYTHDIIRNNGVGFPLPLDSLATEIEELEKDAKSKWIRNHTRVDHDGRARCCFHFCRKLFKDETYLQKHLLKKHSEFLRADTAKVHDSYMMKYWDEEEHRPVPPVVVDCGMVLGLVPAIVSGAATPTICDPEPLLWQKFQERKKKIDIEEEIRRRQEQERRMTQRENNLNHFENDRIDSENTIEENTKGDALSDDREGIVVARLKRHFVDVDDMVEEKVDFLLDDVVIPAVSRKKRRKRKSFL